MTNFRGVSWFEDIGVTSPLVTTGYLPHVTSHHLLADPPPSPSGVTSFMDDPLVEVLLEIVERRNKKLIKNNLSKIRVLKKCLPMSAVFWRLRNWHRKHQLIKDCAMKWNLLLFCPYIPVVFTVFFEMILMNSQNLMSLLIHKIEFLLFQFQWHFLKVFGYW